MTTSSCGLAVEVSDDLDRVTLADALGRAQFKLGVRAMSEPWAVRVSGLRDSDPYVYASCGQLTLHGPTSELLERLRMISEAVETAPEQESSQTPQSAESGAPSRFRSQPDWVPVDVPESPRPLPPGTVQAHLVSCAEFIQVVTGVEAVWVARQRGAATSPVIELQLDQLRLIGRVDPLRERLSALLKVLDDISQDPTWRPSDDFEAIEVDGRRHLRRTRPHPYVVRPPVEPPRQRRAAGP